MFFICLMLCAVTDGLYRRLPGRLLAVMGLCALFCSPAPALERLCGFCIPSLPLFCLALRYPSVKGGDVKLLAVCGLYFGLTRMSYILAAATVFAVLFSRLTKQKSVPLGLMLAGGCYFIQIWEVII